MSKIDILNIKGEKVKDTKLNNNVWTENPNDAVLHNHIILSRASLRQGTSDTKVRSEVSGGGRKPWKQKGTGNARQGSIRSPQWRGGGIVFGPHPEHNFNKKMNRKERRLALRSALGYKVLDNELIVIDELKLADAKTKEMMNILTTLNVVNNKVLIVLDELDEAACLAARNLANIKVVTPEEVNTLDVISADNMLITEKALNKLEEVLGNE